MEAELESRLAQLRHAISTRNRPRPSPSAAPSDLASERRLSQLAEQSHDVRTTLAAEQAQAHVSAPAIEASSATWAQLSRQLHEELTTALHGQAQSRRPDLGKSAARVIRPQYELKPNGNLQTVSFVASCF